MDVWLKANGDKTWERKFLDQTVRPHLSMKLDPRASRQRHWMLAVRSESGVKVLITAVLVPAPKRDGGTLHMSVFNEDDVGQGVLKSYIAGLLESAVSAPDVASSPSTEPTSTPKEETQTPPKRRKRK